MRPNLEACAGDLSHGAGTVGNVQERTRDQIPAGEGTLEGATKKSEGDFHVCDIQYPVSRKTNGRDDGVQEAWLLRSKLVRRSKEASNCAEAQMQKVARAPGAGHKHLATPIALVNRPAPATQAR
jgi:hypothetical protein